MITYGRASLGEKDCQEGKTSSGLWKGCLHPTSWRGHHHSSQKSTQSASVRGHSGASSSKCRNPPFPCTRNPPGLKSMGTQYGTELKSQPASIQSWRGRRRWQRWGSRRHRARWGRWQEPDLQDYKAKKIIKRLCQEQGDVDDDEPRTASGQHLRRWPTGQPGSQLGRRTGAGRSSPFTLIVIILITSVVWKTHFCSHLWAMRAL